MLSFARSLTGPRARAKFVLLPLLIFAGLLACEQPTEPEEQNSSTLGNLQIQVTPEWIRPNWSLTTPGGQIVQGAGATLLKDLSPGTYTLTWQPLNGWTSPNPTNQIVPILQGITVNTRGTYIDQPDQTPGLGTVHIAPLPNGIPAPWTLSGPNGQSSGYGAASLSGQGVGSYTITWQNTTDYEAPTPTSQTLNLDSGQSVTFGKTYQPISQPEPTGTIRVDTLPRGINGSWSLSGPNGYQRDGSGSTTLVDLSPGSYTIVFQKVTGRSDPQPSSRAQTLDSGLTLTLTTFYADPNDPAIADVSGTTSQGSTLTLSGNAFGGHSLDVEWTGDWIESQSVGTNPAAKPGWGHVYSAQGARDHVTSSRAWSGSKSVDISIDQTQSGGLTSTTLNYRREAFDSVYASWWTYIQPVAHAPGGEAFTQLKYMYVTCDNCFDGKVLQASTNTVMNIMRINKNDSRVRMFTWENNTWIDCPGIPTPFTDTFNQAYGIGYTIPWSYFRPFINGGATTESASAQYAPTMGGWTRCELYAYRGSGPDQADGELYFAVTKPGEGRFVGHHTGGVVLQTGRSDCRSEPADWARFVFFHFFDDPSIGSATEKCTINIDDVYLQFGSRARVELGDNPVYASCTRLEAQVPTDWQNDSIDVQLNRGAFSSGTTAYLFVVREDGSVSNGYPVQL